MSKPWRISQGGKHAFWEEAKVLAQFISEPGIVHVKDFFEKTARHI